MWAGNRNGDRWKGVILRDTPGGAMSDRREMEAMARVFARRPAIEWHLVLRADARSADMQYMSSRFKGASTFETSFLLVSIRCRDWARW